MAAHSPWVITSLTTKGEPAPFRPCIRLGQPGWGGRCLLCDKTWSSTLRGPVALSTATLVSPARKEEPASPPFWWRSQALSPAFPKAANLPRASLGGHKPVWPGHPAVLQTEDQMPPCLPSQGGSRSDFHLLSFTGTPAHALAKPPHPRPRLSCFESRVILDSLRRV